MYRLKGDDGDAKQVEIGAPVAFGVCCGAAPHHIRSMAETLGRTPPASRYSEDMSKHAFLGSDPTLRQQNLRDTTKPP